MKKLLAVAAIVALAAIGCGGKNKKNDNSSGGGGKAPVQLAGSVTNKGTKTLSGTDLELEADDLYFNPTFVKAKPGTKVTVELKNEGKKNHTFTIDALKIDEELAPDATKKITITLPRTGTVAYYCRFHRLSGMQGAFFFSSS